MVNKHFFSFYHRFRFLSPSPHPISLSPSLSPGIDLIAAFYGCLYAGVIPVTVRPPHPQNLAATLPTVRMIIDVSQLQPFRFIKDAWPQ